MKIVHLTTVHPRNDIRIAVKEAATLNERWPGKVTLMVADGKGHSNTGTGFETLDLGKPLVSRIGRFAVGSFRATSALLRLRPDTVHFHDPELILVGLVLKARGIKVIYDVHENVTQQIMTKHYMPAPVRWPVAAVFGGLEHVGAWAFDAIVAATPGIAARFPEAKTATVQNFPISEELVCARAEPYEARAPVVAYVGGISEIRGGREMVDAMALLDVEGARLELAGRTIPEAFEASLALRPGFEHVVLHGLLDRSEIADLLGRARVGLVTLHPTPNYLDSFPIKMFEYMAAGLPVIASDFPLWRGIIEDAECGCVVDPMDAGAIAGKIRWMLNNPGEAKAMGQRGRAAVLEKYNWAREADKLVALYERFAPR